MLKSGLIVGAVTLVVTIGASFLSGLCGPCVALIAGLAAGFLAGVFDKPLDNGGSAKSGAGAGAIGGAGALIGQLIGGIGVVLVVGPDQAAKMMRQFGMRMSTDTSGVAGYYTGALGAGCCFGLVDVALMAGLGALGGILWYQISGKRAALPPSAPMP